MTKSGPLIPLLVLPLALFANSPPQPWFKGPCGLYSGQALPKGEWRYDVGFGFTSFVSQCNAWYNRKYFAAGFVVGVGALRNLDLHLFVPALFIIKDHLRNPKNLSMGNISLNIGYQILRDREETLQPDMRLILTEQFPTDTYRGNRWAVLYDGPTISVDRSCTTELALATQKLLRIGRQFTSLSLNVGWAYTAWRTVKYAFLFRSLAWKSRENTLFFGVGIEQSLSSRWAVSLSTTGQYSCHHKKCSYLPGRVGSLTYSYAIAPQLQYNPSENLGFSLGGKWTLSPHWGKSLGAYFKVTWIVP